MLNRRAFVCGAIAAALATPVATEGQHAGEVWRIGVIGPGPLTPEIEKALDAFGAGVREYGHQVALEYRWPVADDDPLLRLSDEIIALRLDVLLVLGERALGPRSLFSRSQLFSPPPAVLVFYNELRPSDLLWQFSTDKGIAGVSATTPTLIAEQLQILRNVVPGMSRLAILWDPSDSGSLRGFNEAFAASNAAGVQPHGVGARKETDLEGAFTAATSARANALMVIASATSVSHANVVVRLAARHRLPTIYPLNEFAEAGGLVSYGSSLRRTLRRAAAYVDRIVNGVDWPPIKARGGLPIEPPGTLELVINLKTARALALTIPPSLLLRADQVIE